MPRNPRTLAPSRQSLHGSCPLPKQEEQTQPGFPGRPRLRDLRGRRVMGSAWSPSRPLTCLCAGARPSQLRTPGAPSHSGFPVECSLTPLFHFLYTVMAPSIYLLVVSPPRSNVSAVSLGSGWDCRVSPQVLPTFGELNPIADIPPSHHSSYGMGGETEAQRVGVPCQARPPRGRDSLPKAPTQCVWTRASGYDLQVSWWKYAEGLGSTSPGPTPGAAGGLGSCGSKD